MALAEGDAWIEQGGNLLIFGPRAPDTWPPPSAPPGQLQAARRNLALPGTLAKLDRFDVLVLDDLGYVRKDQAETNVLFELIAVMLRATQPDHHLQPAVQRVDQIFPDPAMTVAAIDRLVHHATILELKTQSYRRRSALASSAKAAAERA